MRALCSDIDHPADLDGYQVGPHPLLATYASELAPCATIDQAVLPGPVTGDAAPDVVVLASPWDVLTPSGLLDHAPFLSGLGCVCITDVGGHTSFADADLQPRLAAFLGTGAPVDC